MKTKVLVLAMATTLIAGNALAQNAKGPAPGLLQAGNQIVNSPIVSTPSGTFTCADLDAYGPDGTPSWDLQGDPSNVTIVFNVGAGNSVTGVGWDVTLATIGASWLSEAVILHTDSAGGQGINLTVGVGDTNTGVETYSSGGIIDFTDNGIPDIVIGADGEFHLEFYESFDDVSDAIDANYTNSLAPALCAGLTYTCADQDACDAGLGGGDPAADEARFAVSKDFDDNNEASVEVTLSCNTGLPLEQTTTIEEGDGVNFVIGDFTQGELDCEVTEAPVDGYTTSYDDGDGVSAVNCSWEDLIGAQYTCAIANDLDQVSVEVTKEWVDENPGFNPFNVADAEWDCNNVAFGADGGGLDFYTEGSSATDSFSVYPDWDTGTTCSITEVNLPDGGVEVDDSNCQNLTLFPGGGASCTIVNTRLYEGIPTLSQYGLAVLALLMLGMGFVGFRRFV